MFKVKIAFKRNILVVIKFNEKYLTVHKAVNSFLTHKYHRSQKCNFDPKLPFKVNLFEGFVCMSSVVADKVPRQ